MRVILLATPFFFAVIRWYCTAATRSCRASPTCPSSTACCHASHPTCPSSGSSATPASSSSATRPPASGPRHSSFISGKSLPPARQHPSRGAAAPSAVSRRRRRQPVSAAQRSSRLHVFVFNVSCALSSCTHLWFFIAIKLMCYMLSFAISLNARNLFL